MVFGAQGLVYPNDLSAARSFLRQILGLSSPDAGHGWLAFPVPPAELAVHPAAQNAA
jgi:hypothetical protein